MFQSNTEFSIEARALINTFKRTWRQNKINFIQQGLDLKTFNISRKHMRHYNDNELHQTLQTIIKTLTQITHDPEQPLFAHRGITDFTEKLKQLCKAYTQHNNSVQHIGKNASNLLIHVLQSMSLILNSATTEDRKKELESGMIVHIKKIKSLNHPETLQSLQQSIIGLKNHNKELYLLLTSYL